MSAEMRTSWERPHAWVTEASLSTMTERMLTNLPLPCRTLARARVEHAGERDDAREAECVRRRPLAGRLAVHAARGRHEGVGRLDALDEQTARLQFEAHLAGYALLRRDQQRLDVAAHGIQELALVHQVAVRLCQQLLDALLPPGERELLELAVRREQHFGGRCLERHPALGADDGVAEVDAAADAEGRGECLELLDDLDRRGGAPVERGGSTPQEAEHVTLGLARAREGVAGQ